MGLFSRKPRPQDSTGWTPVTIHLIESRRPSDHGGPDDGEAGVIDFLVDTVTDRAGTPYQFVVEVHGAGQPYRVEHRERVPDSATGQGVFARGEKIPAGIELPGWVDPANASTLRIDWSQYKASPEAQAAAADAGQAEQDRIYAQHVLAKTKPKQQQQLRDSAWTGTWSNAQGVASGHVDLATWERSALMNLRRTLISPEQYAQARAVAAPESTLPPA